MAGEGNIYRWYTDRWKLIGRADKFPAGAEDPFVLRVTEPDATNSGPRVTEAQMSNYAGSLTSPPSVIDRMIITGGGLLNPPTGFVMRDSVLRMPAASSADQWGIRSWNSSTNITIEYSTLEVPLENQSYWQVAAIHGSGFVTRRLKVTGWTDGFDPAGIGKVGDWYEEGSYIADLPHFADDGYPGRPGSHVDGTHNDPIQASGNLGTLSIIGSALHAGFTSCLLITKDISGYANQIIIEDLFFRSDTDTFGSMLNIKFGDTVDARILRPRFSKDYYPAKARMIMDNAQIAAAVIDSVSADRPIFLPETGDAGVVPIWNGSTNVTSY